MTALPQRRIRNFLMVAGITFVAPAALISSVTFGVTSALSASHAPAHVATVHVAGAGH